MKVSIIVPCYNAEKYISESLDSILNQTYKNIEIICVDDGSTDKTREVIEEYAKNDSRITLICQENSYAGIARNNGIKNANGKYIMFLDADDFFEKNMIEVLLESALKNNSDIVLCGAYKFDNITNNVTDFNNILRKNLIPENQDVFNAKDIPKDILNVTWDATWNKLFRLDFIKENNLTFQDTKVSEDVVFNRLAMILAERISFVDKSLIYYRVNNNLSLVGSIGNDVESSFDFYNATLKFKNELNQRGLLKQYWIAFVNKCSFDFVNFLKIEMQIETYKLKYNFLKETGFEQLELNEINEEDIVYSKEEFLNIKKYDVTEYLFYSYKQMQKSNDCKYQFPYDKVGNNKKIALYAAGEVGKSYYSQLLYSDSYIIAGWFDRNYEKFSARGLPVNSPEIILDCDFDLIVVAIEDVKIFNSTVEYLINLGVPNDKILKNNK